jgi:hypothetical protein
VLRRFRNSERNLPYFFRTKASVGCLRLVKACEILKSIAHKSVVLDSQTGANHGKRLHAMTNGIMSTRVAVRNIINSNCAEVIFIFESTEDDLLTYRQSQKHLLSGILIGEKQYTAVVAP